MLTFVGFLLSYAKILSQAFDVMNADFESINILDPQYVTNLFLAGGIAAFTLLKSQRELGTGTR